MVRYILESDRLTLAPLGNGVIYYCENVSGENPRHIREVNSDDKYKCNKLVPINKKKIYNCIDLQDFCVVINLSN